MTAKKLVEELERIIAANGNITVGVGVLRRDHTDTDSLEVHPLKKISVQMIYVSDGDGFIIKNRDGSERAKWTAVIEG